MCRFKRVLKQGHGMCCIGLHHCHSALAVLPTGCAALSLLLLLAAVWVPFACRCINPASTQTHDSKLLSLPQLLQLPHPDH